MTSQKISQLTEITAVASADYFPIVQNSDTTNKRVALSSLLRSIPSGTESAPSISFTGDTNTGIYSPGADKLTLSTGGTGWLTVDPAGRILVGTDTNRPSRLGNSGFSPQVQVEGETSITGAFSLSRFNDATGATILAFNKARGSQGAPTIVSDGDLAGQIVFSGYDGSNWSNTARISSEVDGTPGVGDMPGTLQFYTTPSGSNLTQERLRITPDGNVAIGTTSPASKLSVSDSGSVQIQATTGTVDFRVQSIDANSAAYSGTVSNHAYAFTTNNSERARIDSSGRLLVGTSSTRSVANNFGGSTSQVLFETVDIASYTAISNKNDTSGPIIALGKSRSGSIGGTAIVLSGDSLGKIRFAGADGTDIQSTGAEINCEVDGTPGTNDMPGRLVFSTTADGASSPTERMRIDKDGIILFNGKTSVPDSTNGGFALSPSTNERMLASIGSTSTAAQNLFVFYNPNGLVGTIATTGSATAYNTSSDYRLKENVTSVTDGITRLQQLKPIRFNFIADPTKTVDGFIAHEAAEVVPECVTGEKDAVDDEGNPQYQGIDQSKLVPLLTAALQEAIGEIESLKARVAALESV